MSDNVYNTYLFSLHNIYSIVPSAPPRDVLVIPKDSRSVSLSWNAPPAADHNGQLTGYTVKVKDQNWGESRPSLTTENTCTSTNVDGLKPNTDYIFEVSAMTAAGSGVSTPTTHRTTEEGKMAYYDYESMLRKLCMGPAMHMFSSFVPRPLP